MAKVMVKFMVEATQYLDWPDDEMEDFTMDNLECNIDVHADRVLLVEGDITSVEVDNEPHEF